TKQLEAALQVPCVTLVPLVKNEKAAQIASGKVKINSANKPVAHSEDVFRTVINSPLSNFAEAIRAIKLSVDLHVTSRSCKVIGFTSTLPNEGKSTLAASLAQLIAQAGGRILLVDCDLRNPSLSRKLGAEANLGVVDVVSRRQSVADA